MKYQLAEQNIHQKEWDEIADHPLQSWAWGEARKKMGIEVCRIIGMENDTITAVYQMTFHKIPFTSFTIGYLPRTKLFTSDFIQFVKNIGEKQHAILITCEPYVEKTAETEKEMKKLINAEFRKSKTPLFPSWTQMIDLTPSEEELLQMCKPKTRYNILLAKKKGVQVFNETNSSGLKSFISLYFETCGRQHYKGHTKKYHEIIFTTLKNIAHILIARYDGIALASYELFLWKDTLYYPYGGSSSTKRNYMASNLLLWEAMLFGKRQGAKIFDLWGSLPPLTQNNDAGWAGFTRFKEGYNARYVEFVGSYDIIINAQLYNLYNVMFNLRSKLLHIF